MTSSAKSFFKAMSRKKPEASDGMLSDLPKQTKPKADALRRPDDYYPTGEPDAIRALLHVDGGRVQALGSVWGPAAGAGHMVREIRAYGLPCIATDLRDRGCPDCTVSDFLTSSSSPAPAIITNPPYDQINARDGHGRWLRHTLALPEWRYCALLLSWEWPAARTNGLGAMLDAFPFSYVYLCRWKIDFTGEGHPPNRHAWFVWDRDDPRAIDGSLPEPGFRWLAPTDHRQDQLL